MSGSTGWLRDGPREYGRRTLSRENARPPRNDYTEHRRPPPKHSMSRASDLLQKIKEDIDEHRAETVLEKIRRDITMDVDDGVCCAATAMRKSLPPERGKTSSRTLRKPYDDQDYEERRLPRPRRRTSRHHESSSSSSSSSSSHGKLRRKRSRKSKHGKGKRRQSKGKKRREPAPAKNGSSSSSSSSSSGRRLPRSKGGKSIEFVRQVTERLSSESPVDEDPAATADEFRQQYLLIAQPGSRVAMNEPGVRMSGCPVLNALAIGSREQAAMRTQSRAFEGGVYRYGTDRQPSSMSAGGALYRYESQPEDFKRE
ncbi:hypothetical protein MTO96_032934 [Rhipicephalus appendiculatus]